MHSYPKRKPNESWEDGEGELLFENDLTFLGATFENERENKMVSPLDKQVGGSHYKDCKIQPVEYIASNNLDFFEGNIIKYTTRHRTKGEGEKDIQKVIHYAELILKLFYGEKKNGTSD
tara:strand:+ start:163 stop:519 length:357 start_codon:yes stop_codon:yes gene_type:complete